ncbi:SRPBCC family protein [Intrasporangium sp.]|uniref:SRPBCC family protein n=1 Tax=Intrasporangium sp. TaxID=1925024 RepID=UPI00293B321A|nr:SRPBCC family protein [Intrasporangium sp.]MDV3222758.1 SRPBCC family protein [Intrasporangium sp.]
MNTPDRSTERAPGAGTAAALALAALGAAVAVRSRRRRTDQHGKGRPGPLSLRASVTVNRPPDEVYAYWRDFAHLPTFMTHLESVTTSDDNRSTWVATAPFGKTVRWEAEMTGDEPGQRISWRSLPGADIDNSGTVHFAPAPGDRGTEVSVALHYDVSGGRIGQTIAKLLGEEPEQQVRDDLRRFKQVLETGDVVRSDALPDGIKAKHAVVQRHAQPATDDIRDRGDHELNKENDR